MPVIGENIVLASTTPNFSRDKVKTIADLRSVKVKHYDVGHIVYCDEDKRHYIFRGDSEAWDDIYGYFDVFYEAIDNIDLEFMLNSLEISPVYPKLDTEEDFLNSLNEGGKVSLNNDLELSYAAQVTTKSTVLLNGNAIIGGIFEEIDGFMGIGDSDSYAFWVLNGGDLTIDGNGVIRAQEAKYSMAVWADGGTVTIKSGRFYNSGEGSDLIYASAGGKVYIYGGEFHPCEMLEGTAGTADKYVALNIKDKDKNISEIKVYGGIFYNFNPADNQSEGPHTNYVAEGYESVKISDNVWEVRKIN